MARKPNPALLGGFVLGAVALAVAGLVVFGGGKFFRTTQPWVAYFDESIKGLSVGAPVTFRGVRVGAVTDIKVVFTPKAEQVRIPVFFEIDAARIRDVEGDEVRFAKDRASAQRLFERGLRARLEVQSFVTGQLSINLDFHPGTPIRLVGGPDKVPECPTIPSTMSALGRGLEELNSAELAKNVQDILQGMARLVNGPELKAVLVSGSATLKGLDQLAANADARVTALGRVVDKTSANANGALEAIQTLVRRVDAETVPAVSQVLADLRPLVEEIQRTAGAARGALERAETALATMDGVLDERSPLQYQIKATLQEVAAAARAFRTLSSYLERRPEALLLGKGGR